MAPNETKTKTKIFLELKYYCSALSIFNVNITGDIETPKWLGGVVAPRRHSTTRAIRACQ